MSETKFTPGPWRIDKKAQFDSVYRIAFGAIVGANGEPVVLFDPSDGEYALALDDDSADAKLIVAAPKLYSVLHQVAADIEAQGVLIEWHQAILDVLAEARGEA